VSDLATELRNYPRHYTAAHKAADEIERLREALEKVVLYCDGYGIATSFGVQVAREALAEQEKRDG
jgi:hypothetical protein